jgi:hypothetical protein
MASVKRTSSTAAATPYRPGALASRAQANALSTYFFIDRFRRASR